ncbi:MAG TPA: carboxypeptidase regulatory-like domain-containing protein [Longimicrobium sp.]|nr:carboxypeptidase regulatory-like domain-containing protein [Longimicrobium sp.]
MMILRALSVPLSVLALSASALAAQTARGAFVGPDGQPVAGARAVLRSADGREAASAATGADGRFVIRAPAAGTFVLRIERIGYAATETPAFPLGAGETVERRISGNPRRIALEGIVVQSRSRCTPRPGSGPETATVWEEARKVLGSARESAETEEYRYQVRRFWRRMDERGETILADTAATGELPSGTPFQAVPPEHLSRFGYVEPAGDDFVFHAPDARVLLSDQFQERHCFALVRGEGSLIGLSFEPLSNARPDVRGTLWLDRATAELRRLEYRYTSVPALRREGDAAGGWMEFTRLPDGRWIVGRWAIRMPVVTATRVRGVLVPGLEHVVNDQSSMHFRLSGILVEGGEVLSASAAGQAVLQAATPGGSIHGVVFDSTAARPLAGARVVAAGHQAVADSLGRFSIPDLPGGDFELTFTSPRLDSLGFAPAPVRVTVREGEATEQTLAIPPLEVVWGARCTARAPGTGVLAGMVRDAAGGPSPGAQVTVAWAGAKPGSTGALADSAGVYRVCEAPAGVPLTVRVATRQAAVSVSDVRVAAGRPHREDVALPAPRTVAARAGASGGAGISGVLRDAAGTPLAGATVRMDARPAVTTDARGRFRLGAAAGAHRVIVQHPAIGSRGVEVALPADAVELELRAGAGQALAASVQRVVQLAAIGARAQPRRAGLETLGFYERQKIGIGVFLTDSVLQVNRAGYLSNVLRRVPGIRITNGDPATAPVFALSTRNSTGISQAGGCLLDVYLDGALVAGMSLGMGASMGLNQYPLQNIEAVEVYRGPSEMPPQYRNSTSTCGVILIWSRH